MNNKQKAENFLNLAKETYDYDERKAKFYLEVSKVHSLMALEEAVQGVDKE